MSKISLCFLLLSLLPFFAMAQKAKFELFTTADGLASNESHHLVQDNRGFLWFLNASRIYRYDGRNFRQQPAPPRNLPGADELLSAMTGYQDSLLFIFAEKHAFLLNPHTGTWQAFPLHEKNGQGFKSHRLVNISSDNLLIEGIAISATDSSKFWRFQNGQLEPLSISNPGSLLRTAVVTEADDAQEFYLFHQEKLIRLDGNGRLKKEISLNNISPKPSRVISYKRNRNGQFFHTDLGFFVLDSDADILRTHPVNTSLSSEWDVNDFQPMDNGDIWITGDSRRLYQYLAKNGKLYSYGEDLIDIFPYKSPLKEIFKDQTGILWIRTQLGLLKITPQGILFDTYLSDSAPHCIGYCSFRGMTEGQDGMIYASFYIGIAVIDPSSGKLISVLPGYVPFGLEMEDNQLVLQNGSLLDPKTGQWTKTTKMGSKEGVFARDNSGQLWWSNGTSLSRLDKSSEKWEWLTQANFQSPNVSTLHFGQQSGLIWRGAAGELGSYSIVDKTMRSRRTRSMDVPISQVLAIEENEAGLLWLATDIGLVQYDPISDKIIQHYTVQEGLPNDFIAGMLSEGDSCLWLGTNNGLSRFNIQDKSFVNFFKSDGMTHNEFNRVSYFKASDGRMYFGSLQGLNAFYPDEVIKNYRIKNKSAQVVLSSFERMDEQLDTVIAVTTFSQSPTIELHHWDRSFIFEYALTDFNNPSEVFYSFKMEGYEDNWSRPSTFNFTRFSSLPPGNYVFRVKARDSRGLWNPNELKVQVQVLPPWWATWWAYGLYLVLLLGVILGVIYFLKRRWILQNQLLLEQEEALRLKELDSFKSRLYTNLTHEFRTPLTVVLGMTDQLENESRQLKLEAPQKKNLKEGFQMIRRNGQSLLRLINQLLDLSKLENRSLQLHYVQADIINYVRYLTESFRALANSRNISLQFFSEVEKLDMDFDPDQLMQIFTNLISNALKFTPSGGAVNIRLAKADKAFMLEVKDTGFGIPASDLPYIFDRFYQVDASSTRSSEGTGIGLAHTQELVRLMEGSIEVNSFLGEGSCFQISLPVRNLAAFSSVDQYLQQSSMTKIGKRLVPQLPLNEEGQKLLIIEDNPDVVTYLKSCLADSYQLEVAYNGRIGIEQALEHIPDLIICDVMMPEKDGFEVCEILKNDERTSHVPIVLLTAKADQHSRLTGLRSGADAYLSKPFNKKELLVRLEQLAILRTRLQQRYAKWAAGSTSAKVQPSEEAPEKKVIFGLEDAFLQKVKKVVDKELGNVDFNPGMLSQELGLSSSQFYRKIKALTGTTPALFVRVIRLHKAKELLTTTDLNVSEIAYEVGFSSPSYFSRSFSEEFGSTPNENRGR